MTTPSLEKRIVGAALKDRAAFLRIEAASRFEESYTPYTSLLLKLAARYYGRDTEARFIDISILEGWIQQELSQKNHELYINYLRECYSIDVSAINVSELVLEAKRKFVGNKLAGALLENDKQAIDDLRSKYDSLDAAAAAEEEEETFSGESVQQLLAADSNAEDARIRLLPKRLDELCRGRARRGHHLVLFARPETGKTAFTLTLAYGFALQGLTTIIFGNEEPVADTRMRAMCCFTGMDEEQIKADPDRAQRLLDKRGWKFVRFIPIHPGTPKQIDAYIERYAADCAIVDQIRNLYVGAETRVNQLEMAATAMRNIGKRRNCLMVSVTQAGDSADNKLSLEMGDIDFSNTGIPATADLMIGVGVNKEYDSNGMRMVSTPKNKIGGVHGSFPVKISANISRIGDI